MLSKSITKLVQYGMETGLVPECEKNYTINLLLDVFLEDEYVEPEESFSDVDLEETLNELDGTQEVPADYKEISFVCLRPDGSLELPSTLGTICRKIAQKLDGFEGFHFHQLRHTYTSNLLANGV